MYVMLYYSKVIEKRMRVWKEN